MNETSESPQLPTETPKTFAGRLLAVGKNRFELLEVELQQTRGHFLRVLVLAAGTALFGLLACLALTAAIAVWLWSWSPVGALLALAGLHGALGIFLYCRLAGAAREWQPLAASLEQLRKDLACLEKDIR